MRDEFAFLTDQSEWWRDTYRPHGGSHWVAVPRLIYEGLWRVVGMTTYRPYQAVVVGLHLALVVMLHHVMRRAGVRPWLAAGAAAIMVLSGPGETTTVWAFQMTIVGSLAFGLAHLLLVDHDGPVDRRDGLGLVCGVLAMTCSGVGVTTTVGVVIATWVRRGWRPALLQGLPLAVLYGTWAALAGAQTSGPDGRRPTPGAVLHWVANSASGTFHGIGHFAAVGWLLAAVLALGIPLLWRHRAPTLASTPALRLSMPVGLAAAALFFVISTSLGRAWAGARLASSDRYVYVEAALLLPILALAAEAVARRWRAATGALVVLFLLPIPFNVRDFDEGVFNEGYMAERRRVLTTAVRVPFAHEVPPDVQPAPDPNAWGVTMGFLLTAEAAGRLTPSTTPITRRALNEFRVRLGVSQQYGSGPARGCHEHSEPVDIAPEKGDEVYLGSPVEIRTRDGDRLTSRAVGFTPGFSGVILRIELPDLQLRVGPAQPATRFSLCDSAEP